MTQVDGLSLPVRLPIDGDAFDAACEYARTHDLTISAAASEMLRSFAPSVDAGTTPPGCPEDGREGSEEPPASLPSVPSPPPTLEESKALHPSSPPFHDVSEVIGQPIPHVHLRSHKGCVYGNRCGR